MMKLPTRYSHHHKSRWTKNISGNSISEFRVAARCTHLPTMTPACCGTGKTKVSGAAVCMYVHTKPLLGVISAATHIFLFVVRPSTRPRRHVPPSGRAVAGMHRLLDAPVCQVVEGWVPHAGWGPHHTYTCRKRVISANSN